VKVYGEREWKVRQHCVGKRRTWRNLHIYLDETTLEIISLITLPSFANKDCHSQVRVIILCRAMAADS
jgi:hypothetical protein